MLGILYLILIFLVGAGIIGLLFPNLIDSTGRQFNGKALKLSPAFVLLPGSFMTGSFVLIWITYLMAWALKGFADKKGVDSPLFYADIIVFILGALFAGAAFYVMYRRGTLQKWKQMFTHLEFMDYLLIAFALLLSTFLMYYTFYVKDDTLYVGGTVYSDFSPHLAMIRSFSYGTNFPTMYPHFTGQDIKYHFLFQFLVGNLEYLGLRLDHAFNIPSLLCFFNVQMLLYALTVRLTGRKPVGILAVLFFLFRSSAALYDYLVAVPQGTNVITSLLQNSTFIGTTAHEDWGLWNLNVYCNQRHLAIGLTMLLFLVYLFMDHVFAAGRRVNKAMWVMKPATEEGAEPIKVRLQGLDAMVMGIRTSVVTAKGWRIENIALPLYAGILLSLGSFINGACVIATLTVLFFLALAADRRLEFLLTAILAVLGCYASSALFIDGSATSLSYYFGFIAENRTLFGVTDYILTLCGILPLVLLAAFTIEKPLKRWIMIAFAGPFVVAFTLSLTIDVTVNHKYVMMSLMLLGIFAAIFVDWLWNHRNLMAKLVCVGIVVALTSTGVYDLTTIIKNNNHKDHVYAFNLNDPVTEWVQENSTTEDVWLTPMYTMNRITLGGAMLYYGWPYYAWSAGYDTYSRDALVRQMYGATDRETLKSLIEQENIRYIVIDNDARNSADYTLNEALLRDTYECVYDNIDTVGENEWTLYILDTSKPIE